jgi:hypothetical protein
MTEQPAPERQAEKERQEPLWASFTRADMRLFLVTFAGTVAANLVTVVVVAVAIIFARPPNSARPTAGVVFNYLYLVSFGIFALVGLLSWFRKNRSKGSTSRTIATIWVVFATVTLVLMTLVLLLVLLGYAVGVK